MRRSFAVLALAIIVSFAGVSIAEAQCVSLTTLGSASTQDFDTLSNTAGSTTNSLTITGWFMTESGGGARDNEQYGVDTGGSGTGDTYSYGSTGSTDRALGGLQSGTLIPVIGACFTNNTGSSITSLDIAYTGEQWRLGSAGRTDQIDFQYSLNATSLTTGTWTDDNALDFVTPVTATTGAKDGNAVANRTARSSSIPALSIASGATFWIRWNDVNASGADDGLAVDDFSLTPQGVPTPTLNIDDVSVTEGAAGTVTMDFSVTLTLPAPVGGVTFDIATADNTATTADNDYVANSLTGQTIIAGGTGPYIFSVTVNGDTNPEATETFFVNITNVVGATAGDVQGTGTITTDDAPPLISIDDVTAAETNSGTTTFDFSVTLSAPAPAGGVTFDIATADDTATLADNDYVANSLTSQTIVAGGTGPYLFSVTVNGDTTFEANETFFVNLTNVTGTGVVVADGQGLGTITNDDAQPAFSIANVAVTEGNAGTSTMTFTVTASPASGSPMSVDVATADSSATVGDSDYVAVPVTTLTFAPNDLSETFDVTINGDTTAEGDEQFFVNLTNATGGATISVSQALGIIRNDDPISISAVDTPFTENFDALSSGTAAATTPVGWTFVETGSASDLTYGVETGGSTTGNTNSYGSAASADRAFGGLQSGSLVPTVGAFFRNDTGTTVTSLAIQYIGEQWRAGENNRADRLDFQYSLDATSVTTGGWTNVDQLDFVAPIQASAGAKDGNAAGNRVAVVYNIPGLSIAPGATFWIRYNSFNASGSDDGLAVDDFSIIANFAGALISINDVSANETNAGTTTFTFTVSLSQPAPPGSVTFDIATQDGTATTANFDYVANSIVGATIAPGNSSTTFSVTVNGDVTPESTETFLVNITNVVNALPQDLQGVGTIIDDDTPITFIHDVQGPGASSPLVGNVVLVSGIVTGVKSNGFYVQEEDADVDADPQTSEGVFVFTSSAPPAAATVGNLVQVSATVVEFVPSADPLQPPLTELSSPTVVLLSTGNPLPAPIPLTATFPDPAGVHDQLERLEGMRVSVASLTVSGPTLGNVNEAAATATSTGVFFGTVTGVPRPFREAGIQAPDPAPSGGGTIPPIPRWDANPELLRVDSDGLVGGPLIDVGTGAVVTGLVGPLDYTFRKYTILPDPGASIGVIGGPTATAVTAPTSSEFTVATYNLERFFDTVNDPGIGEPVLTAAAYDNRLSKASLGIRDFLRTPDILGVVEVENLTTLQDLAARISTDAAVALQPDPAYVAYLVEGNDIGGIDVGFLVKTSVVTGATPRVTVNAMVQENAGELFVNPDTSTSLLNDRPSLRLMAVVNHANGATYPVTVIVNHLRSLNDSNSEDPGSSGWATLGARVRAKRQKQAESLANLVQARQTNDPTERIILVGDFNAFEFNDGLGHSMGVIDGTPVPDNETVVPGDGVDLVNPNLDNLFDTAPAAERYSFVFDGSAQSLDHVLVNTTLIADTLARREEHPRINADFPQTARNQASTAIRLADHDPIVAYFQVAAFATAGVSITKVEAADPVVAGTNVSWTITVTNAGPDPADSVEFTDTLPAGTTFVSLSAPGGWSCSTPVVGAGGTITCSIASLGVSGAAFTLTALVDPAVVAATVISNSATVTSATADSDTGDNSATEMTTVAASADLSITKVDTPDPVDAGANITYTITVTNAGPSNAAAVSVDDTLPAETTFVSLVAAGGWSCATPVVGATGTVTCSNPSMAPGSAVFTLTVAVGASEAAGTLIDNTVNVSSSTSDPNPGNESASAQTTVATIGISIGDFTTVAEGDLGNTAATFVVTLERAPAVPITVNFATANDSATAGSDFAATSGMLTFPANANLPQNVTVQVIGDTADEPNETYFVNLSGVTGPGHLLDAQGLGTIIDDDGVPTVSVNDRQVVEGSGGAVTPMIFTISLSNESSSTVTVDAATAMGTATAGSDFTMTALPISFPPGSIAQSFTVPVLNDVEVESDETFFVNLSSPVNAGLGDGQGIGTIVDDDGALQAPDPTIVSTCLPVLGGPCVLTVESLSGASQRYWTYSWFVDGVPAGNLPSIVFDRTEPGTYVIVVEVTGLDGQTGTATITITIPAPCPAGMLCMHEGRFEISLVATDQRTGASAPGVPLSENDHFGYFALPALTGTSDNPEVFVKILDGRPVNGEFWVFYGGLTDLEYVITVVDNETGETKTYEKPAGSSAGGFDVGAGVTPEDCEGEVGGTLGTVVEPSTCSPGTDRLCLLGGQFMIELTAVDQRTGNTGDGVSIPVNDLFGYFALPELTFDATNPEVFVKVLDGTVVNGHYWIFFAGLTDLEYTITVTNTTTGEVMSYTKEGGSACGGFDVNGL